MTVCIGVICDNGKSIVMTSDRMITAGNLSVEFEHPTSKMDKLTDNSIITTAGDALLHTDLLIKTKNEIENKKLTLNQLCKSIKKSYINMRNYDILENIIIPNGFNDFQDFQQKQKMLLPDIVLTIQGRIEGFSLNFDILLGGVDKSGGHLYFITNPGVSRPFDILGYHAIGIGSPHALMSLIANNYTSSFKLKDALLVVYEAKKIAEKAPGVGSKFTDIAVITKGKNINLDSTTIDEIDNIYKESIKDKIDRSNLKNELKDIKLE